MSHIHTHNISGKLSRLFPSLTRFALFVEDLPTMRKVLRLVHQASNLAYIPTVNDLASIDVRSIFLRCGDDRLSTDILLQM